MAFLGLIMSKQTYLFVGTSQDGDRRELEPQEAESIAENLGALTVKVINADCDEVRMIVPSSWLQADLIVQLAKHYKP